MKSLDMTLQGLPGVDSVTTKVTTVDQTLSVLPLYVTSHVGRITRFKSAEFTGNYGPTHFVLRVFHVASNFCCNL